MYGTCKSICICTPELYILKHKKRDSDIVFTLQISTLHLAPCNFCEVPCTLHLAPCTLHTLHLTTDSCTQLESIINYHSKHIQIKYTLPHLHGSGIVFCLWTPLTSQPGHVFSDFQKNVASSASFVQYPPSHCPRSPVLRYPCPRYLAHCRGVPRGRLLLWWFCRSNWIDQQGMDDGRQRPTSKNRFRGFHINMDHRFR